MKLIDVAQEAHGFIAIGQQATGVIAIGQVAFGVVAVGQGAFGLFTVGQVSVGLFSAGMASAGMFGTAAMVGIGGRGFGGVLPLSPTLGPLRAPDEIQTLEAVRASGKAGWCAVGLDPAGPTLLHRGSPLPDVLFNVQLRGAIGKLAGPSRVYARLVPTEEGWVCDHLARRPRPRVLMPAWWGIWALQSAMLVPLGLLVWGAGIELGVEPVLLAIFGR